MPGITLNLNLPLLSDTMATMVAKTSIALSAIQDDLAGKINPSEMNINSALDMAGSQLKNTGSLALVAGNIPTLPGSMYYNLGEFYVVDSTGIVRLTSGGALDASSIGAISGLGGTNAAVTYDLASTQFRFTSNVGVYADLVARNVILQGSAGSVQIGVDPAINSARQFNIKSLPATGVSLLVYNGSTSTLEDGAVTGVTNTLAGSLAIAGSLTAAVNVTATDFKITGVSQRQVALDPACQNFGTANVSTSPLGVVSTTTNYIWNQNLSNFIRIGDRVKALHFRWSVKVPGSIVYTLNAWDVTTGTATTLGPAGNPSGSYSDGSSGAHTFTATLATPYVVDATHILIVTMHGISSSVVGDTMNSCYLDYDHP